MGLEPTLGREIEGRLIDGVWFIEEPRLTDGARLTEMGIPTPNIFTGMKEVHGPLEWISLQDMAKATDVCVKLAQLWAAETS